MDYFPASRSLFRKAARHHREAKLGSYGPLWLAKAVKLAIAFDSFRRLEAKQGQQCDVDPQHTSPSLQTP